FPATRPGLKLKSIPGIMLRKSKKLVLSMSIAIGVPVVASTSSAPTNSPKVGAQPGIGIPPATERQDEISVPEMVNTLIGSARSRALQPVANKMTTMIRAGFGIWQTPCRALPDQAIVVLILGAVPYVLERGWWRICSWLKAG